MTDKNKNPRDPAAADDYFQARFDKAEYRDASETFDDYRPAYRYGAQARVQHGEREWDEELEAQLRADWARNREQSRLDWDRARAGVREAYTSPYLAEDNTDYDSKPDFNENAGPKAGLFRTR